MSYISLYRKWRPQVFADVVGQEHITRTILNALQTGRVAHAYLFSGPRGTGKTTMAKLLAKAVNCQDEESLEPCNKCASCLSISAGNSMDVMEIDGASNRGIDQMRELRDKIGFAPVEGKFKVYIIDEVHMLTTEAFNALLKTLEEPPSHVLFIFATTELHKVPATILSRCQCFQFHRIRAEQIVNRLKTIIEAEKIQAAEAALYLIARVSQGGLRDAISLLDQCISFAQGEINLQVVEELLGLAGIEAQLRFTAALVKGDLKAALAEISNLYAEGRDLRQFVSELLVSWRGLLLCKLTGDIGAWSSEELARFEKAAGDIRVATLTRWLEIFNRTLEEMRWANRPQLTIELATIKAAKAELDQGAESLLARIEALEEKLKDPSFSFQKVTRPEPPQQPQYVEKPAVPQASMPQGSAEKQTRPGGQPLAQIQAAWSAIGEWLRAHRHVQIQAFIRDAQPYAIEDQTLVLAFKPTQSFHKANVEREANKQQLQKAIRAVTGHDLQIRCILTGEQSRSPKSSQPKEPPGEMEPLVREALRLFGGHVIKKEEVDSR